MGPEQPPENKSEPPKELVTVDPARIRTSERWFVVLFAALILATIFACLEYGDYGGSLFVTLPLTLGVAIGFLAFRRFSFLTPLLWGLAISAGIGLFAILPGLEGALCVIMAYGVIVLPIAIGLCIGTAIWRIRLRNNIPVLLLFGLVNPLSIWNDRVNTPYYENEVVTTVVIEANEKQVWQVLTGPVEFQESDHLLLRNGVTYPLSMAVAKEDDGLCLRCRLNNDSVRLQITEWSAGRSFAFVPVEQPIPMREVSFVGELDAPHLHGYFGVDRGEFRIEPIDASHTRLVATTRYHHRIAPAFYWRWWSDHLIDTMHRNVLKGVAAKAEES